MRTTERLFGDEARTLADDDFRLLLLATIFAPWGAGLVSPILDSLTGVFGVSPARIGLMVAAVTAPGIVVIPLMGTLADRYGRKAVLVAGLLLFGLGGAAIPATTDFEVVLVLRLVQGLGFSGIVPTLVTAIGDLYDGAEEATAQGLRLTTVGLSQVVFPFVAGSLVVLAWWYPFALYALTLPVAALVYLRFDEPSSPEARNGARDGSSIREVLTLAARPRVAPILVGRSLPTFVWLGFLTYNSILVVRLLGGTPRQAGLLVAVGSLTFAVAASQAGRVTGRFDGRFRPLIGAHVGMALGFTLFAFAPSFPVAAVGILVGGFGFGLSSPLYRSLITGFAPARSRGSLVSVGESLGRLGATLSPIVIGGVVGLAAPTVGFGPALRWTLFAVAIAFDLLGVACLVAARAAPPLE